MKKSILVFIMLMVAIPAMATEKVFFTGEPQVQIQENGLNRQAQALTKEKAAARKCVITKKGDQYYWTSRENTQLVLIPYGSFLNFVAVDGSGYIRIISSDTTAGIKPSDAKEPEERFNYVEHQIIGLKSVTYYGKAL